MLFSSTLALALTITAAAASPIFPRAGGPAFVPIPSDCTITNPLPHASSSCGNGTVNGYMPSPSFTNSSAIYSFYLGEPDYEPLNTRWEGCLEQCHGLSGCVSAFLGFNVPTPKGYYGTAGGVLSVACFMFDKYATPNDFVAAPKGQYVNETAGNIYCPS